jgi:hypothetical protein
MSLLLENQKAFRYAFTLPGRNWSFCFDYTDEEFKAYYERQYNVLNGSEVLHYDILRNDNLRNIPHCRYSISIWFTLSVSIEEAEDIMDWAYVRSTCKRCARWACAEGCVVKSYSSCTIVGSYEGVKSNTKSAAKIE